MARREGAPRIVYITGDVRGAGAKIAREREQGLVAAMDAVEVADGEDGPGGKLPQARQAVVQVHRGSISISQAGAIGLPWAPLGVWPLTS